MKVNITLFLTLMFMTTALYTGFVQTMQQTPLTITRQIAITNIDTIDTNDTKKIQQYGLDLPAIKKNLQDLNIVLQENDTLVQCNVESTKLEHIGNSLNGNYYPSINILPLSFLHQLEQKGSHVTLYNGAVLQIVLYSKQLFLEKLQHIQNPTTKENNPSPQVVENLDADTNYAEEHRDTDEENRPSSVQPKIPQSSSWNKYLIGGACISIAAIIATWWYLSSK